MPADLLTRIALDAIYPPFLTKVLPVIASCRAQGADYYGICGTRTYAQQRTLYLQGRGLPGPIVTKADAGKSAHNFGLALDLCRDADATKEGLQPDWRIADYELLAYTAKRAGLDAAFFWHDFQEGPHVQLDLSAKQLTLEMLDKIHARDGMGGVWAALNAAGPW